VEVSRAVQRHLDDPTSLFFLSLKLRRTAHHYIKKKEGVQIASLSLP
jgi:hypothetical protein